MPEMWIFGERGRGLLQRLRSRCFTRLPSGRSDYTAGRLPPSEDFRPMSQERFAIWWV